MIISIQKTETIVALWVVYVISTRQYHRSLIRIYIFYVLIIKCSLLITISSVKVFCGVLSSNTKIKPSAYNYNWNVVEKLN